MLQSGFTSVLKSRNRDELQEEVVGFTRRLGFETVSATVVIDHLLGEAEFITVDNTPRAYRELFQNRENWRRDPVMQHCKRHSMPIIWDQGTYLSQGLGDKWEEQARFGYRHGIAMALHMPEGRHFFLGVDRDQPVPPDAAEITRLVADLQLFAVHAQDAALRILTPVMSAPGAPSLTPRELETLRWTMEGKTAWEVGNLLGISERTAALHVNNATHKLDCVNKHQAVLKALRLGLIR
ncbi:MAG TPA: autoinducer binding domain-containing protein [Caldimonas sp.]|jgi:DNA-binding CsgD family transcriptional regulator|nr:autoinducer binding domain-containing protein [Caldimonas sp.]HEX2540101.1 autoinducer binding domain-containing protein [Caldimonas sp.]